MTIGNISWLFCGAVFIFFNSTAVCSLVWSRWQLSCTSLIRAPCGCQITHEPQILPARGRQILPCSSSQWGKAEWKVSLGMLLHSLCSSHFFLSLYLAFHLEYPPPLPHISLYCMLHCLRFSLLTFLPHFCIYVHTKDHYKNGTNCLPA